MTDKTKQSIWKPISELPEGNHEISVIIKYTNSSFSFGELLNGVFYTDMTNIYSDNGNEERIREFSIIPINVVKNYCLLTDFIKNQELLEERITRLEADKKPTLSLEQLLDEHPDNVDVWTATQIICFISKYLDFDEQTVIEDFVNGYLKRPIEDPTELDFSKSPYKCKEELEANKDPVVKKNSTTEKLPEVGKKYKDNRGNEIITVTEIQDKSVYYEIWGEIYNTRIGSFFTLFEELPDQEPTTEESSVVDGISQKGGEVLNSTPLKLSKEIEGNLKWFKDRLQSISNMLSISGGEVYTDLYPGWKENKVSITGEVVSFIKNSQDLVNSLEKQNGKS